MSTYEGQPAVPSQAVREVAGAVRDAGGTVGRTALSDATQVAHTVGDASVDVARTAKDEAASVFQEASGQAQRLTADVRDRVRTEIERQHESMVDRARGFAGELHTMAGQQPQTPAKELVGMLASRSSTFADYLDQHGPEAVLTELQAFARRRPGTFLVAAVAAGFVVGRLGKGLWQNQHEDPSRG